MKVVEIAPMETAERDRASFSKIQLGAGSLFSYSEQNRLATFLPMENGVIVANRYSLD